MKDRIYKLMQSRNMNQQAFSNFTGIAPAALSNIFSERTRPTLAHVELLTKAFPDLNLQWMISGEGEMFQSSNTSSSPSVSSVAESQQSYSNTNAGSLFPNQATDKMADQLLPFSDDEPAKEIVPNFHKQKNAVPQAPVQQVSPIVHNRKITEIRVFYDDQTWESFVPKR